MNPPEMGGFCNLSGLYRADIDNKNVVEIQNFPVYPGQEERER